TPKERPGRIGRPSAAPNDRSRTATIEERFDELCAVRDKRFAELEEVFDVAGDLLNSIHATWEPSVPLDTSDLRELQQDPTKTQSLAFRSIYGSEQPAEILLFRLETADPLEDPSEWRGGFFCVMHGDGDRWRNGAPCELKWV